MIYSELAELKSKTHNKSLISEQLIPDISTLRSELVKSKKNYTDFYDFNSSAYVTIDENYIIQSVNYQAAFILGIDRCQLHTKIFLNFIPSGSQDTFINNIEILCDTQCKQTNDLELLQKGGSKREVILESMLIESNLIRLCIVDVTNHRLNRNKYLPLELAFNLTNLLFQQSTDAMASLDSKLYVSILTPSFSELFSMIFATKIDVGMCLIKALADFPDLKLKIINACNEAIFGKKTHVIIENHLNENEIYHCYEICVSSLCNQLTKKNELFLRIKNITETKIQEREHFKQQEAIAQSNRISAMGEMASAIAHEINQPLTAIIAYSRSCLFIINKKWGDKEIHATLNHPLEQIALQGEHAGSIIHSIKNLMRKGNFYTEETNINALIKETTSILSYAMLDFKLKISLNLIDTLPLVVANKTHIMQVISNLVQNSVEALQTASVVNPELLIETSKTDDYIHVHVRDNGPGILSKYKNKILNTYFTTKARGTGLGLGICRTLIEEHGGKLIIKEHQEKGAWFIFTLPINRNAEA